MEASAADDHDVGHIALRPASPEDLAFLCAVYASTRQAELTLTGWDPEQQRAFVRMQFDAQHRHYQTYFPDAAFSVIEVAGAPAGRLYVDRSQDELRIIDIALLPEYCNHGIGGHILLELLSEASQGGKRVIIHVERHNPAVRLYLRLGFAPVSDDGIYRMMTWPASEPQAKTAS